MTKRILITGASSGIGRAAALELAARGFRVVGTSRQPDKHRDIGFEMLKLDVRSEVSVRDCVAALLADGPLDVLVNNAGYGIFRRRKKPPPKRCRRSSRRTFSGWCA